MSDRDARDRIADHAMIERLADDLIPALVNELEAGGLGELEIREADWRIRLRSRAALDEAQARVMAAPAAAPAASAAAPAARAASSGHPHSASASASAARSDADGGSRVPVASPAVGIFMPASSIASGSRVRGGDTLGMIDVLGIGRDVLAPVDGILGALLAEPGQAVEFGQELSWIVPDGGRQARRTEAGSR